MLRLFKKPAINDCLLKLYCRMKHLPVFLFLFCFVSALCARTLPVRNGKELQAANNAAQPGDVILLQQQGNWKDVKIELSCKGTAAQPITFCGEGKGVTLSGKSQLNIGGEYLVIKQLFFTNGYSAGNPVVSFRLNKTVANYCRFTGCVMDGFNNPKRLDENYWIALYGQHNRVDHNRFTNKLNLGVLMAVILEDERSRENYHSVDSNYFGYRNPLGSNAGEIIRVGVSQHSIYNSFTNIHHNIFERCSGEVEIVSIKSAGNFIRDNVFKECQGCVALRHGNNNTVEHNIFYGGNKEGTGGVRIINEGQWVVNNLFLNCRGIDFRSPLAVMNGVPNSPLNRYMPVRDAVIANNTFYGCTAFSLCEGSDSERSVTPQHIRFFNNVFQNGDDHILFNQYDEISGFRFAHNLTNTTSSRLPAGFVFTQPAVLNSNQMPAMTATLLDPTEQANGRLLYGLDQQAGSDLMKAGHYKKVMEDLYRQLAPSPVPADITAIWVTAACKTTAELKAAFRMKQNVRVMLTGHDYYFDSTLNIEAGVILSAPDTKTGIRFSSAPSLPALFLINTTQLFQLSDLNIDGSGIQAASVLLTDTTGQIGRGPVRFSHIQVQHINRLNGCNSFFTAAKGFYSSEIEVKGCTFPGNNCTLFRMDTETDNKGWYNAERVTMENNRFDHQEGSILTLYRGGNDESTMGPKLSFTGNILNHCTASTALLQLTGVQQSFTRNNRFMQANTGAVVIRYTDFVRAHHYLSGNRFTNSGSIAGNKYLEQEKKMGQVSQK